MRDYKATIGFTIVVLLIIGGWIYTAKSWSDCNDAGGEYVRGMNGLYKCVQVVEVK